MHEMYVKSCLRFCSCEVDLFIYNKICTRNGPTYKHTRCIYNVCRVTLICVK